MEQIVDLLRANGSVVALMISPVLLHGFLYETRINGKGTVDITRNLCNEALYGNVGLLNRNLWLGSC